jgi:predicted DCC family thiol-disulfide oxidoreductase YuxK
VKRDWTRVPADEVEDGLILFDGVCVLCSGWVDFVINRDPSVRFRFLSIQTPRGREIARRFGVNDETPETNVVVKNGEALFKFDTVLAVVGEMPGWRWLTILRHLPRGLRNWLYDRIARNRYAVFGKRAVCRIPTADEMRHMAVSNEP